MPIPSSGALSLSTIQTEFGGANPISLSEYYAGAGLVPAGTSGTNGAVPASGAISMSQFYGTAALAASIDNQSVSDISLTGGAVSSNYALNNNGTVTTFTTIGGAQQPENWLDAGSAGSFECRATLQSGNTPSGTLGTWLSLSTSRSWTLSLSNVGVASCQLLIEIRIAGGAVLDSATIFLDVSSEI